METLEEFSAAKRMEGLRARCPVCALPADVREQLREASRRRVALQVQATWLASEHDARATATDLLRHGRGRHDYR